MKCPTDETTLLMSERQGVEIDYCPECRGVWLDRGELDKILERAQTEAEAFEQPEAPVARDRDRSDSRDRYDDRDRYDARRDSYGRDDRSDRRRESDDYYRKQRKRKNPLEFLGDIFEG